MPKCCHIRKLRLGLTCWKTQQLFCSSAIFKQFFSPDCSYFWIHLLQEIRQYLVKVVMVKSGSSRRVVNSLIVYYWLNDFFYVDQSKEIDLSAGLIDWFKFRSRILHRMHCDHLKLVSKVVFSSELITSSSSLSVCPCWVFMLQCTTAVKRSPGVAQRIGCCVISWPRGRCKP